MYMKYVLVAVATTAIAGMTAGAASAQAMPCSAIGETGQWIAGTSEASDISVAAQALVFGGLAIPANDHMLLAFSLSAPGDVRIEAQPFPGGDSVIELYDALGTLLVTDDDSGGGLASRAETALEPGQYCLLTRGWAGNGLTADVSVGRLDHDAITAGLSGGFFGETDFPLFVGVDPCTAATPAISLGDGPLDAMLGQGGASAENTISGTPSYRFSLASPQSLSIRAENPSADPYIYIFDGDGTLLAENDDYDGLNSRIDFTTPLSAGTYCVGMRALSNPDLPVILSVVGYDAAAALRELYATGDAAPPLDGSYPVVDLGLLPARSVRDAQIEGTTATWFAFQVSQAGAIVIDAVEVTDSDPLIVLYDDLGNEIAYNDDFGGTLNSQIVARVQAGRYLLAVRQYSDFYSGIIRIAIERYAPATD